MNLKQTIVFTDGSSRGNPGPGGWGAIVAFSDGKIKELGGGEKHTTNNRMELMGAISALFIIKDEDNIVLNTDSSYVINGITKWVYSWQKNGWKNSMKEDVVNRDLWEKLTEVSKDKDIKWNYVGGHVGIPGNERCDEIATNFADLSACDAQAGGKKVELFDGKKTDYEIDLSDTEGSGEKKKNKSKNKSPAYSYLSLVEGKLQKHKTWPECEKRVKGVKGNVKFKKAVSEENEREIMKEWNIS